MSDETVTHVTDELGEYWIDNTTGDVTLFDAEGTVHVWLADGSGWDARPDGSILAVNRDGVWTHQSPGGEKLTWSSRDEKWIELQPQLDGSRWEHDPQTGAWTERDTPHPERPQGSWHSPDGRMVVTEVNHNLFMQRDGQHFVAYNSGVPETGPLAGQWHPVTRDTYASTLASNQELEAIHHDPAREKQLQYADNLMQTTRSMMEKYVEVSMLLAGRFGGPVGWAASEAWNALKTSEALKHAKTDEERMLIVADAMDPGILSGPDGPGPGGHHGYGPGHTPDASGGRALADPVDGATSGAPAKLAPDTPAAPTPVLAPEPPGPTPKPADGPGPPAPAAPDAAAPKGIPADPFATQPLTNPVDQPLPGATPPAAPTSGTTPLPPGVDPTQIKAGPEPKPGPTVNLVEPQPIPDGLTDRPPGWVSKTTPDYDKATEKRFQDPTTSGSTKPAERLGAALEAAGDPRPGRAGEPGKQAEWNAHHIVPTEEGGARLDNIRQEMVKAGIDPDSVENGVWLPRDETIPNPNAAMPHQKYLHRSEADYAYTIHQRLEGKTGNELRAEVAKIKDELSGAFGKFDLQDAPQGWLKGDPDGGHVPEGAEPGGTGQGSTGPVGGAAPPAAPPAAAPPTGVAAPVADGPGNVQPAATAEPQSAPADQPDPGPAQVVAGAGAGVDVSGDKAAISQDASTGHANPQGPPGVDHSHAIPTGPTGPDGTNPAGPQDPAHPGAGGPHGAHHPAGTAPDGADGTGVPAPGHPPGDPGAAHPLQPAAFGAGPQHGVGTPDQLYPDGPGAGPHPGAIGGPGDHAVGLPDDPIGHLAAADPHAGVGLPGAAGQDPHADASQNPDNPHNDKDTNDAIHPEHHPPPPPPLPDHHAPAQYHAPPAYHPPPPEPPPVITQIPNDPGGG